MADTLISAFTVLAIPVGDIWIAYVSLGGDLSASQVDSFLRGESALEPGDYDRLVQVANEEFMDRGEDHLVPYAEEMAGPPSV